MKEVETFQLSKNEERLVELLQKFDYTNGDAKILAYMLNKKKAISKQIERDMDLRQPEVSIGIKKLRKQGTITVKTIQTPGKGRPTYEYILKTNLDDVRKNMLEWVEGRIAEQVSWLEELDTLFKELIKK